MSNCLILFLKNGTNEVGSKKGSTVQLGGLGIGESHCKLITKDYDGLEVEPIKPDENKTMVNGQKITEKTEIKHLDRVSFGVGKNFKVVIPK